MARWILLGNPENRRVTLFQEALARQGEPPARVVRWIDFLRDPQALGGLSAEPAIVRVDSFGEDWEVEKAMLVRGFPRAKGVRTIDGDAIARVEYARGRILCPRQLHEGFLDALDDLARVFASRPAWRTLADPRSIADLFDKRVTSRLYESKGIPVPPRLDGVTDVASLSRRMREEDCPSVFVKLSCGSSASCLGIYTRRGGRESFFTTIEQAADGWFNTLNVRRVTERDRIEELLSFLLAEGSQVERSIPKAKLGGAWFDCRVLVVAGEPAFLVVRQNRHPITNLHLGGWRGDPDLLKSAAPAKVFASAMESCRAVWHCHRSHQVGVDLLFEDGFTGHRVIEANAFGDLLPNLSKDGLSVYEWEIRESLRADLG